MKYQIIYADPPWKYKSNYGKIGDSKLSGFGAALRYELMTTEEIKSLPIKDIADKNCILFLWTTNRHLEQAIEVIRAWGFEYRTVGFCWVKVSKNKGLPNCRLGYWTLPGIELCLIGIKGKPKKAYNKIRQVALLPREGHSVKPDFFREQIVKLMGNISRIELFARQKIDGWDVWGNEVENSIEF